MCIYKCEFLVLTSYFKTYIFQLHTYNEKRYLSWSAGETMVGNGETKVFRALLALALARCNKLEVSGPDIGDALRQHAARPAGEDRTGLVEEPQYDVDEDIEFQTQETYGEDEEEEDGNEGEGRERGSRGNGGGGGGGGGGSGSGTSKKRGRGPDGGHNLGNKQGPGAGSAGRDSAGASQSGKRNPKRRTRKYSNGNVLRRGHVLSISKPIGYQRLTRSMSRRLLTSSLPPKQDSSVIVSSFLFSVRCRADYV